MGNKINGQEVQSQSDWDQVTQYINETAKARELEPLPNYENYIGYEAVYKYLDTNSDGRVDSKDAAILPPGFQKVQDILKRHGMKIDAEPMSMFQLVSKVQVLAAKGRKKWSSNHRELIEPVTPEMKQQRLKETVALERDESGHISIFGTVENNGKISRNNHGGGKIYSLLKAADGDLNKKISIVELDQGLNILSETRRQTTLSELLISTEYFLELRDLNDKIKLPGFAIGSGSRNQDAYNYFLARIKFTDPETWKQDQENIQGESISFNEVIETAHKSYLDLNPSAVKNPSDHSYYHMPEVILEYAKKTGDYKKLQEVKDKFLRRELKFPMDKLSLGSAAHYTESLGILLSSERLSWSRDDKVIVHNWINQLRGSVADLGNTDVPISHLLKGLLLIEKHATRVNW